jgi:enoyl-CoA hydratase
MTKYEFLSVEQEGPVVTLTVERADKLNALNKRVLSDLSSAFRALIDRANALSPTEGEAEPVRAVILTGAGRAFVAGADIAELSVLDNLGARRLADHGHALCALIESAPFPVIAAVNGFALGGGCEIALACDFIYAATEAKLGQPEVAIGIIPGYGGTQRLTRRIGAGRARELIYTGDMVSAEQALAMGLVNAVVPQAELLGKAREVALRMASRSPLAVAAAKRAILHGESLEMTAACELEKQTFAALFGSEDQREGMKAFLSKGKHVFKGR